MTLRQALLDAAFHRWLKIAPLDELLAKRDRERALAVGREEAVAVDTGHEFPAGTPGSVTEA